MSRVLIIGAGGVGRVVAHKCAQAKDVFTHIMLASRTLSKCKKIQKEIKRPIKVAKLDADKVTQTTALIKKFKPDLVINVAQPYQNLPIMEACAKTKVSYLDTSAYEPRHRRVDLTYKWQWAYHKRFKNAGIMGLLSSGFDPGVVNVFCAYAQKHYFDKIHTIDILDCNAGDHGQKFATNFDPETNIREITLPGKYWKNGKWISTDALSVHFPFRYPQVGPKESYLMFHEELESLVKHIKGLKRIRFWMTFTKQYMIHLNVLENVGMICIDEVSVDGKKVIPLKLLKELLPDPASLGKTYKGKISIGCLIKGVKKGKKKQVFVYTNLDHEKCYKETKSQAISYSTGVPATVGAILMLTNKWKGKGVFNMEQLDPDPYMKLLPKLGIPWKVKELPHNKKLVP